MILAFFLQSISVYHNHFGKEAKNLHAIQEIIREFNEKMKNSPENKLMKDIGEEEQREG